LSEFAVSIVGANKLVFVEVVFIRGECTTVYMVVAKGGHCKIRVPAPTVLAPGFGAVTLNHISTVHRLRPTHGPVSV